MPPKERQKLQPREPEYFRGPAPYNPGREPEYFRGPAPYNPGREPEYFRGPAPYNPTGDNSGIGSYFPTSYGNNSGAELPPKYLSGGNNSGIGSLASIPQALIEAALTPPDGEGGWFNNNPWALNFLANKFGDPGSQQYLEDRGDRGIPFLGGKWKPKFKRGEEGGLNVGVEGKWSW